MSIQPVLNQQSAYAQTVASIEAAQTQAADAVAAAKEKEQDEVEAPALTPAQIQAEEASKTVKIGNVTMTPAQFEVVQIESGCDAQTETATFFLDAIDELKLTLNFLSSQFQRHPFQASITSTAFTTAVGQGLRDHTAWAV